MPRAAFDGGGFVRQHQPRRRDDAFASGGPCQIRCTEVMLSPLAATTAGAVSALADVAQPDPQGTELHEDDV
jgi:hypothetical protein